ncbi:MAG: lactate racemase domain-containing protein [Phycisphaerae bacterium]|nr:lactate racemase domain-containing protein [Phycisphaerae bacterium]
MSEQLQSAESEPLPIHLPDEWEMAQVAASSLRPAGEDWPEELARALNQPGTGLPLERLLAARRDERVVLVVEDLTRHSPLDRILPILLREIRHAGVEDSRLEIVFATGMHPPLTADQARAKLGPGCDGIAWRCNPWQDAASYDDVGHVGRVGISVDRGVLRAGLRILVSSVSPHLQAGFGGGYKMLLPGCASLETIRELHRQGIGRSMRQLVGIDAERNAMRQVIDDGGELIDAAHGKTFVVQYILDEADQPAAISTGEPLPAQRMLAKHAAVSCGVIVPSPGDVLITDASPRDFDLWQSFKGIANTLWAARPGGVIICLTRCPGGMNNVKPPRWPLSPAVTRRAVQLLGPTNLANLVMRLAPHLAGDAAFFIRMATQILHRNWIYMVSPKLADDGAAFPGIRIFATLDDALAAARLQLGPGRQRVVHFPAGGITYPVPQRAT